MKVDLYWPDPEERVALDICGEYPALYFVDKTIKLTQPETPCSFYSPDCHITLFYKHLKPGVTPQEVEAYLESQLDDGFLREVEIEDRLFKKNIRRQDDGKTFILYHYHVVDQRVIDLQRRLTERFCTSDLPYIPPHITVAIDDNPDLSLAFGTSYRHRFFIDDGMIVLELPDVPYSVSLTPYTKEKFQAIRKFEETHKPFFTFGDHVLTCSHPEFFKLVCVTGDCIVTAAEASK